MEALLWVTWSVLVHLKAAADRETNVEQFGLLRLPLYLSSWTAACFWGPALGPVVSGFAVSAKG